MLNKTQRETALHWYAVKGYSLQAIADHFGLTRDDMARELCAARK